MMQLLKVPLVMTMVTMLQVMERVIVRVVVPVVGVLWVMQQ